MTNNQIKPCKTIVIRGVYLSVTVNHYDLGVYLSVPVNHYDLGVYLSVSVNHYDLGVYFCQCLRWDRGEGGLSGSVLPCT